MSDRETRRPGNTAVIIAVVVVIMLAVSCLVGVVLFGAGIFVYRTTEQYETEIEQLLDEPPPAPADPRDQSK